MSGFPTKKAALLAVVIALPTTVLAYWYLSFFDPVAVHLVPSEPLDIVADDLNLDGKQDIAVASRNGKAISIFLGDGNGTLSPLLPIEVGLGVTSLTIADMNGDDVPDIAATVCNPGCTHNGIFILHGNGDGTFQTGIDIHVSGTPYNIADADFNGDGYTDLVSSDYPAGQLTFLFSSEQGEYDEWSIESGVQTIALEVADINRDRKPDVLAINQQDATLSIFINSPTDEARFQRQFLQLGPLPYALSVNDFDNDGIQDIAIVHSTEPGSISILRGNNDNSFELTQTIPANDRLIYVETADFNQDGFVDLLVTRHEQDFASVFLNLEGSGFSKEPHPVTAESKIYSVALGLFNGDDLPDLATVDFLQSTVSLSMGSGGYRPVE
jgi:hypothetical protein